MNNSEWFEFPNRGQEIGDIAAVLALVFVGIYLAWCLWTMSDDEIN